MSKQGQTLWEMMTDREKAVARAAAVPPEVQPDIFNPLGLHIGDITRIMMTEKRQRFQVVEVDVFDRGVAGKTVDYRLYKKPGEREEALERYLRVFPGTSPDGKPTADMLLLEFRFNVEFDQGVADQLDANQCPLQGDEYAGFVRNNGADRPYEVKVTEINVDGTKKRRMKYWDFVRTVGDSFEACFIEQDSDTGAFDAYVAVPLSPDGVEFLRKK